jgi:3-deoxy-manno-octulosonate cytidylyltransferase (CMP-KDO synthetase)
MTMANATQGAHPCVSDFCVLIPARLASTRLPDKPLADIHGLPMVVRVARQAALSNASRVVVATDHPRIVDACQAHGVSVVMTRADHPSGSDRLAEACDLLALPSDATVVNVQGDEPLISPELINAVARTLQDQTDCVMSTAAHPVADGHDFINPNVVKVVTNRQGHALYFSRAPIAWWRDGMQPFNAPVWTADSAPRLRPLRHVGIYAYRVGFLRQFPTLASCDLEHTEMLEQLRVLWHGERIAVHVSDTTPAPGVDTPEDLARVRALLADAT